MDLATNFLNQRIVVLTDNVTEQIEVQKLLYDLGFYWLDGSRNTNSHTYPAAIGIAIGLTKRINGFVEERDLDEFEYFSCTVKGLKKAMPDLVMHANKKPPAEDNIRAKLKEISSIDWQEISSNQRKLINEFHSKIFN